MIGLGYGTDTTFLQPFMPDASFPLWPHLPCFSLTRSITCASTSLFSSLPNAHLKVIALAMTSVLNAVSPHPDGLVAHSPLLPQCCLFREALPNYFIPNNSCTTPSLLWVAGAPDGTYLHLLVSLLTVPSMPSPPPPA